MVGAWSVIVIVIIISVALFFSAIDKLIIKRKKWALLSKRRWAGGAWRECFADASKEEIREFLLIFTSAFGFPAKMALKFRPDDQLTFLYDQCRGITPIDQFEVESFAMHLEDRFKIRLETFWRNDLTLGGVFERIVRTSDR